MTGHSRAGPRRGASISRPAAVIFTPRQAGHDEHEAVALEQHERLRDEVARRCHGAGHAAAICPR
jgi:hypothetical protein